MRRALAILLLAACGEADPHPPAEQGDRLSSLGLFEGEGASLRPAPGVIPYEVIAPLFSDFSLKHRFLRVPVGEVIGFAEDGRWTFPEGTIAIKTFAFPRDRGGERRIETRLLVREGGRWVPHVYLWNDAQTDAFRVIAGAGVPVSFRDPAGTQRDIEHAVPDLNQCARCHASNGRIELLGTSTRQLDREGLDGGNQLEALAALGLFDRAMPPREERRRLADPADEAAPVEPRARAWLEANCAHCHTPEGAAGPSGLLLAHDVPHGPQLGICKIPVSAGQGTGGRSYGIVPGEPDASILVHRMESATPGVRMPELGGSITDPLGIALVRAWIAAMSPAGCGPGG